MVRLDIDEPGTADFAAGRGRCLAARPGCAATPGESHLAAAPRNLGPRRSTWPQSTPRRSRSRKPARPDAPARSGGLVRPFGTYASPATAGPRRLPRRSLGSPDDRGILALGDQRGGLGDITAGLPRSSRRKMSSGPASAGLSAASRSSSSSWGFPPNRSRSISSARLRGPRRAPGTVASLVELPYTVRGRPGPPVRPRPARQVGLGEHARHMSGVASSRASGTARSVSFSGT